MVKSDTTLPAGLDPAIAETVAEILENARSEGWILEPFKWSDVSLRIVCVTARRSSGKSFFLMCGEARLVSRLRALLV